MSSLKTNEDKNKLTVEDGDKLPNKTFWTQELIFLLELS